MQRNDPEDTDEPRSRQSSSSSSSHRNSSAASAAPRKNSVKTSARRSQQVALTSTPSSVGSTPRRACVKKESGNIDLTVTGRQLLKRSDRAHSLPVYHRRPSTESTLIKGKRSGEPKRRTVASHGSGSRHASIDDDMTLDLSQVSDFEDINSKYGFPKHLAGAVTSTPKQTPKSISSTPASAGFRQSLDSCRQSTFSSRDSRDSLMRSMSRDSPYVSSSCYTSLDTTTDVRPAVSAAGEWHNFWLNYNNSVCPPPVTGSYYDQCPTPFRSEDLGDLDFSTTTATESSIKRSPTELGKIDQIIRNEGLLLTQREAQNLVKCAQMLGNVLSKAIERNSQQNANNSEEKQTIESLVADQDKKAETEIKKKSLTLELPEDNKPEEIKKNENVMTQTDISLPNTKSAPRIFEKILRQLSRSSIDDSTMDRKKEDKADESKKVEAVKEIIAVPATVPNVLLIEDSDNKEDVK